MKGAARRAASMIRNAKAKFQYDVLETVECGMCLAGAEVKSLRDGQASLAEAYVRIQDGEAWLIGCHIVPYPDSQESLDPCRPRKLLLRRREISSLSKAVKQQGLTLVPLDIHFNERGLAKLTLALCRGRSTRDKREAIRQRQHRLEMDAACREQPPKHT